jgi:hypothetical protein
MPELTCRRCGRPVVASADRYDVFEQMHYVCFHYEYEHGDTDPDEECPTTGCPSAPVGPAQWSLEPRDSLVAELMAALAGGDRAAEALDFRIERLAPGTIRVSYGEPDGSYLITVRPQPRP